MRRLRGAPTLEALTPRLAPGRSYPYVTGTSVLAIKYADGVMMASDTLGARLRGALQASCLESRLSC